MSEVQEEVMGLGAASVIPEDVTTEQVWKALIIKITQPNLFLPVSDVFTRPSDDGKGTYREMSLGPNRIFENIYSNESTWEVKFVVEGDVIEHVNIIHTDSNTGERTLEFYKRHSLSGQKVHWDVPRKVGLGGIAKVLDMAKSL